MHTCVHYITLGSHCKMASTSSSHRVTDLEKIPVRISKDEVTAKWLVLVVATG